MKPSGTTFLSLDLTIQVPVDTALYITGLQGLAYTGLSVMPVMLSCGDTAPVTLTIHNLTKDISKIQKNQRIAWIFLLPTQLAQFVKKCTSENQHKNHHNTSGSCAATIDDDENAELDSEQSPTFEYQ